MTIEIAAFRWVPAFAQGYVKDLRVRWALEEAGLPYRVTLVDRQAVQSAAYRRWQPFGQVPAYRDGTVELFESGAIVLHIASSSAALAPPSAEGRARTSTWVFAALNTIEPASRAFLDLADADADAAGADARQARALEALRLRLAELSAWLEGKDHLEGRFSAGDLTMTTVLRELVDCGVLAEFPRLDDLRRRCQARPAFGRALEAQLQAFRDHKPT